MIYELSSKQLKKLTGSGIPLQIAVPVPDYDVENWTAWAQSIFDAEIADRIVSAEEIEIRVRAIRGRADDTLTSHFGVILTDDEVEQMALSGEPFLTVAACVVQFEPKNIRRDPEFIQWPKKVTHGKHKWPLLKSSNVEG